MKKIYYKDDYSTLAISQRMPCLFQKFKGTAHSSDHYKKIHNISIKLVSEKLQHYKRLNMLVDSSEASPITLEDIEYFRNEVMPVLYKTGIRFIAYVPPSKKISRLIFSEVFNNMKIDNLVIQYFESPGKASKWLHSLIRSHLYYN
jgi:anaerobic ribonucleoside-triphosphate reductase